MKMALGMVAAFIGVLLVCGGFYGLAVCVALSDSEPQFTSPLAGWVIMALPFGSLLCWAGWRCLRHDERE